MSVKVGVRVRPFNQRQKDLNCKLCVDMMGPTTRLFDADDPQKFRDFTFDYSFWSHDQFHPDEKGYFIADGDKYADQQHVFQQVGLQILSNAWQGYHCCLFAYGQTGAGKSYSMVGYHTNKGIVPISCQQIFNRINNNPDKNKQYEVHVSMLEIYNQKVQDLLIPISKRPKQGHKIRQHKTLGIYVQGLSKHYVDTYDSIEEKMEEGGKNRSIAATEMNASSSRAHTIISIQFKQKQIIEGKKREKLSVIYLVDLAGSQKVGKTGATGDRLKQAAGINKSLSVLGLVISTLADKATGKGKGIIVPYRDSCLTRILQNALGGNSKTLMICAISPASDNYEQTLGTLRYADQAKKIQNKAVVNESQTDKMIRNLTAEKDELRQKVAKFQEMFKKLSLGLGIDATSLQQFDEAKQQLRMNTMMMNDMTMSKKQKLDLQHDSSHAISDMSKVDKTKPHLSNLNQDPQLSRKINYAIDKEVNHVGKRNAEPHNEIEIGGMGIRNLHALIKNNSENRIFVSPVCSKVQDSNCYLNGEQIQEQVELKHYDRLVFGTNNYFVVLIPGTETREMEATIQEVDWDFAQNQIYLRKELIEKEQNQQIQRKRKQETEEILKKKEQQLLQLQRKLKQNEESFKNIEQQKQLEKAQMEKKLKIEEAQKLKLQIENGKKNIQDRQSLQKQRIKQKYYFEKKLLKTLPKCIELNLIAKQFKRNISMSVKMLLPQKSDEQDDIDLKKRSIKVKVINRQVGYTYWWDVQKLENRYYIIKDMAEAYFETGVIPELTQNQDPFWDPPEHVLIGRAFLTTKALSYLFDNLTTLSIIGDEDHCGEITVNMIPTDEQGQRNLCQQMDQEDLQFEPEQLMDKPFYYNVCIESASIPQNYQNIYVEYSTRSDINNSSTYRTENVLEKTRNPVWNYKKLHMFDKINDVLLNYLITAKIVFKIYAYEIVSKQKKEQLENKKQIQKSNAVVNPIHTISKQKSVTTELKNHPQLSMTPASTTNSKLPSQTSTKNTGADASVKNTNPKISSGGGKNASNETQKKKKTKEDCIIF